MPVAVHSKDYAFSADYGIAISEHVIAQLRSLIVSDLRWLLVICRAKYPFDFLFGKAYIKIRFQLRIERVSHEFFRRIHTSGVKSDN